MQEKIMQSSSANRTCNKQNVRYNTRLKKLTVRLKKMI